MTPRAKAHAIVAALCLAAFGWLTAAVVSGKTLAFDERLRAQIHQFATGPLTSGLEVVTSFGSPPWVIFCALAVYLMLRKEKLPAQASILMWVMAGEVVIESVSKAAVGRTRPDAFFGLIEPGSSSFPSGHALFSTALYGTLGYLASSAVKSAMQRIAIWTLVSIVIALICLSRVYLGVHYPTDVAGGVLIACFWMNAVLAFVKSP